MNNGIDFWLGPLQSYSIGAASSAESFLKFVKEETLGQLDGLREDCKTKTKDVRERLGRLQRDVSKEQEGLLKSMKEHERIWTIKLESTAAKAESLNNGEQQSSANSEMLTKDVWLSELLLHSQIESFLQEKGKFCQELMSIFLEVKGMDKEWAGKLSQIIAENCIVKSKQSILANGQLQDVSRMMRGIDADSEWSHALTKARLDYEWRLEAPPTDGFTFTVLNQISCEIFGSIAESRGGISSPLASAPSAAISVKPVTIKKSGYLMRAGSGFGKSWNVLFWVLTDSHFLHAYTPEKKKSRRRPSVDGASPQTISLPSYDDQMTKRHLADLNAEISQAWLGPLAPMTPYLAAAVPVVGQSMRVDSRLLEPILSIPLFDGVSVAVESPSENVFVIQVPGSGGFFGRSERKYMLKSFLEEDMVDWCIALKETIAISQAAPNNMILMKERALKGPEPKPASPTWTAPTYTDSPIGGKGSFESPFEEDAVTEVSQGVAAFSFGSSVEKSSNSYSLENPWN